MSKIARNWVKFFSTFMFIVEVMLIISSKSQAARLKVDNQTNSMHVITRYASTPILFAITGGDSSKPDANTKDPGSYIDITMTSQTTSTTTTPSTTFKMASTSATSLNPIQATNPNKDNNNNPIMNRIITSQSPQLSSASTISTSTDNLETTTARSSSDDSTTTIAITSTPRPDNNNQDSRNNNNNITNSDLSQSKVQSILDMSMIIYSAFIVYIAFIKLVYHNFQLINRHFTEPG